MPRDGISGNDGIGIVIGISENEGSGGRDASGIATLRPIVGRLGRDGIGIVIGTNESDGMLGKSGSGSEMLRPIVGIDGRDGIGIVIGISENEGNEHALKLPLSPMCCRRQRCQRGPTQRASPR